MKKINILVITLVAVLVIGGGIYFLLKKAPTGEKLTGVGESLEDLQVQAPDLEFSLSPLPKLNVSSLNLSFPELPAGDIFSSFPIDTNFSYQGNLNVSVPSIELNIPTQTTPQIPSQQQQWQPSASNCAAFSAIPSSQYCSMAGASGKTLCEQCKAAGF